MNSKQKHQQSSIMADVKTFSISTMMNANTSATTFNDAKTAATLSNNNAAGNDDVAAEAAVKIMTYHNTKQSKHYQNAKAHLQAGDFEAALSSIELGITTTLSLLPTQDELHESIAPLYYLYGTTLLYSIEESQDNPENQLMAAQQQGHHQPQQDGEGNDGDVAGDLQIAWENLETARSVLSKMCGSTSNNGELEKEMKDELVMDLAQIHGRLGDLSRHDGHYERAIHDYEVCCGHRRNLLTGDKVWDRKIADVEYSLGMTCLSLAAEGEKNLVDEMDNNGACKSDGTNKTIPEAASAAVSASSSVAALPKELARAREDTDDDTKVKLSPEHITALREKSYRHYVQCSRILAGMIAIMCGKNPSEVAAADSNLEHIENKKMSSVADSKQSASGKTTGLDENLSVQEQAANALQIIRKRVVTMKCVDTDDDARVHDLREMLDEIQETIDTSEKDREGLRDISMMRKKAEEDVKKNDEAINTTVEEDGATTTIGFGQPSVISDAVKSTTIGFVSSQSMVAAENSKKSVAPMMVVKKKKKRDASQMENESIKWVKKM